MQQRVVVESSSRFEPVVEKFASALHATVEQLNANTFPALVVEKARHKFQQHLESSSEPRPSPSALYQSSVIATLEAIREAKKQSGHQVFEWVDLTDASQALTEAERRERFSRLQTSLAQLPENRRRVVGLKFIGLTVAEIKGLLNWNESKVQGQIERGVKSLQATLQAIGSPSEADELATIYQSQPSRADLNRADCLAGEFLTRACTGDVSDSDRLFIADHLTTCQDCAEEYRLAAALKSWTNEAANLTGATTEESDVLPSAEKTIQAAEVSPKWWQALIPRFVYYTGFNLFTAALTAFFFITSLSLATWLVALQFKHNVQIAQLQRQPAKVAAPILDEPVTPETLQTRVEEAQKQLTELQTQILEQNADKVLSNQELLGIQNNTLLKELEDLSKPQLDAPVVDIDLAALRAAEPGKEVVTTIDVPNTSAVFSVILHKPADKNAANYLIELFDAKKTKPLWSTQKKLENQSKIAITLAKRNYPAGKYRFTLSGMDGKKKELLETYQIEVKYQPLPKQKKKK